MESNETIDDTPNSTVPSSLPRESDTEFHALDPKHIASERFSGLIVTAIVFVSVLIGLIARFLYAGIDGSWWSTLAAAIVIILLLLWSAIVWPSISYRHTRWKLDDTGLEIRHGVWWKHRTSVPLARVQHADVSQGPIQRNYDIGTLTVHTAGTANASVDLAGLTHSLALDLRNQLVRQGKA